MNYRDTQHALMNAYPSLYACEADVFNSLFFAYHASQWNNGELGEYGDVEQYIQDAIESYRQSLRDTIEFNRERVFSFEHMDIMNKLNEHTIRFYKRQLKYTFEKHYSANEHKRELKKRLTYLQNGWGNDCWFVNEDGSVGVKIKPIREHSHILNLPDNITSSWLKAAHKALEVAKTMRPTESDLKWLEEARIRMERFNVVK